MLDKIERTASAVSSVSSRFSSAVIFRSGSSSVSHGGTVENAWKNALASSSESGLSSFAFTALLAELEQSHHCRGILSSAAGAEVAEYFYEPSRWTGFFFRVLFFSLFIYYFFGEMLLAIGHRETSPFETDPKKAMRSHKASFIINNHEQTVTSSKPLPS